MGSTPDPEYMVRTALNVVTEDWETFVQSIFGRASLPIGKRCGQLFDKERTDC